VLGAAVDGAVVLVKLETLMASLVRVTLRNRAASKALAKPTPKAMA
jgi:hypothetical protein